MNGRSGMAMAALSTGQAASVGELSVRARVRDRVRDRVGEPLGEPLARGTRSRVSAARPAPRSTGPGRVVSRSARRAPARPMPGRVPVASSHVRSRAVAGRMRCHQASRTDRAAGRRGVVALLLAGLGAAVAVFALGALADVMAQVRVPEATGPVVVRADETLLQLAHRAAPSADPSAVVHRIVELNDLGSPSVQPGQVLVSPIG